MHAPHLKHVGVAVGVLVAVREARHHGHLHQQPGEQSPDGVGFAGLRSDRGLGVLAGVEPYEWDEVLAAMLAAREEAELRARAEARS